MGPIDRYVKYLVQQRPDDMVHLFRPDAQVIETLNLDKTQIALSRTDVDSLLRVQEGTNRYLLYLEYIAHWSSVEIDKALMKAARARATFSPLPVLAVAVVISGPKGPTRERLTLDWSMPEGSCIFTLEVYRLGLEDPEHLLATDNPMLWALTPFTEHGTTREVVEQTVARIRSHEALPESERSDLLAVLSIALEHRGVLNMLVDILGIDFIRSTPSLYKAYNDGIKEGRKEGLEKGLEKGVEKGVEKAYREIQDEILAMLQTRLAVIDPELEAGVRQVRGSRNLATYIANLQRASSERSLRRVISELRRLAPTKPA